MTCTSVLGGETALRQTAKELSSLGRIDFSVLDLADKNAIADFCAGWQGQIYGVVNNAAVFAIERIDEQLDSWDETMAVTST